MEKAAVLKTCFDILKKSSADKFDIYWEKNSHLTIEVREGKLDHISRATNQGVAIRVLKNSRIGFAYAYDTSSSAIEKTVQTALEIASLMPEDPLNDLEIIESTSVKKIPNLDFKGIEVPLEEKINLAKQVESLAKNQDLRIKRVRKSGFHQNFSEISLLDSQGTELSYSDSLFAAFLTCVAEQNGNAETGSDGRYSTNYGQLEFESVAKQAAQNAVELLGSTPQVKTRTCPAVFKNSVVADLLGFIASSFSAESIDKNFSLLSNKKGTQVFSRKITIVDDPLLEGGVASAPFDGEGSLTKTLPLLNQGNVESFLYDTYYARKHETKSTGNSRRSLKSPPHIGTSNFYLKKGNESFEKLIRTAKNGIYITQILGLHTSNPVTGEFSVGASGILIENGELTTPVKGFAIGGNILNLFSDVQEVGNDFRYWGSIGAPTIFVEKLQVSGS